MTSTPDSLLPEGYDTWPRSVQRRFVEELYALYFPERTQQASGATTPQPGDDIAVDAEIVD